jgi:uncharacterized protein involved in cysteine biosynthesis
MIASPATAVSPMVSLARALTQLADPIFIGVVVRSVAWSIACVIAIHVAIIWAVHRILALHGALAWGADLLGSIGASMLTLWLFLPVAAAIGTLYFDRIAFAVERRFYPWLPGPKGAPMLEQLWDGCSIAWRVLLLNIVALGLALLLPGIGFLLGWFIAAYAIGRGLFVAIGMRRMPRRMADSLYRSNRPTVLIVGAVLAAASYVPVLNLLVPVIGTAAMVHILDAIISAEWPRAAAGSHAGEQSDRYSY